MEEDEQNWESMKQNKVFWFLFLKKNFLCLKADLHNINNKVSSISSVKLCRRFILGFSILYTQLPQSGGQ